LQLRCAATPFCRKAQKAQASRSAGQFCENNFPPKIQQQVIFTKLSKTLELHASFAFRSGAAVPKGGCAAQDNFVKITFHKKYNNKLFLQN
jgi:hypothetical protein